MGNQAGPGSHIRLITSNLDSISSSRIFLTASCSGWAVTESVGVKSRLRSVESRGITHLESIGLRNALSSPLGGPQAHGNSKPRSFGQNVL